MSETGKEVITRLRGMLDISGVQNDEVLPGVRILAGLKDVALAGLFKKAAYDREPIDDVLSFLREHTELPESEERSVILAVRRLILLSIPLVKDLKLKLLGREEEGQLEPVVPETTSKMSNRPLEFGTRVPVDLVLADCEEKSKSVSALSDLKTLAEVQRRRLYGILRQYSASPNALTAAQWIERAFEGYRRTLESITTLQLRTGDLKSAPVPLELSLGANFSALGMVMKEGNNRDQMLSAVMAFIKTVESECVVDVTEESKRLGSSDPADGT